MDRRQHDFAASSGLPYPPPQQQVSNFQQQQQQFGFHPQQHQQFPSPMNASGFMPPHPSMQQFPYQHLMQQQQQQQPQLLPHPPHPQMFGQQKPQAFLPHLPPHHLPSPFPGPYDSAPPPPPPPADPELQKRIDKLVEYSIKNGPEFEAMMRDRQKDNPDYAFLFGGEGHDYYRYKQFISMHPPGGPFPSSSMPMIHHPPNPMMSPSMKNVPGALGVPPIRQPPFPPFHEHQQLQQHLTQPHPFAPHARPDFDQSIHAFRGLSGPLPADVAMELNNVLANLNGTKESIKSAKIWFMQRSPFAPALAEALRVRVYAMDDSDRQMHIVYLANDILFDSLQRRTNLHELDNEALAFRPVLGSILGRIYHFPQNKEENQSRLEKILQFWASKEVFDQATIFSLEKEMKSGPPANTFVAANSLQHPGMLQQPLSSNIPSTPSLTNNPGAVAAQQFIQNVMPSGAFPGSIPLNPSAPTPTQPPAGEKPPPYPLFPPGLIPGMVRKMQIGSGVPYSPLSPLDIPTVIPPSDTPQSAVLERVSKFFKEIGEVNPSEGPMGSESQDDYEDYERDSPQRKGGACIPPPPNLHVDPETGTYADGSTDKKSGSGRLGLGATADPNEPTQYDDVYTSYRKHRSTNYHTTMSARSATR